MIEVKSITHTVRLFADRLDFLDLFKVILYCNYRGDLKKIPGYYKIIPGKSCETDLRRSMDEILAQMKSNTRNEIRRAEREGCEFEVVEDIDEFVPFYNAFCDSKGFNDYVSHSRLAKYKSILISKAVKDDTTLAMHVNLLDEKSKTALLILSSSQRLSEGVDRKLIGWGNRFLHYKDLEYLKSKGFGTYDWSGVCMDPDDPRYSIGQFKLGFGGKLVDGTSLMTPLYAFLEKVKSVVTRLRHRK